MEENGPLPEPGQAADSLLISRSLHSNLIRYHAPFPFPFLLSEYVPAMRTHGGIGRQKVVAQTASSLRTILSVDHSDIPPVADSAPRVVLYAYRDTSTLSLTPVTLTVGIAAER